MAEVAINQEKLSLKGNGIILAILAGIAMMVMFIEIMLVPALPHIAAEYPQDAAWVSWVLSAYLLSGAISTLLLGRLGDIYGKKRVLLIALAGYIIGILGSAFSWSMGSLIAFRAIQGIGMGMFVLSFGIIRDTFPKRLIPVAIGLISAMFSVGVSIGLLAGGYIVSVLSWRDSFYIVAPLMVVMAILVWLFVKDNNLRTPSTIDFVGAGLISGGVLFFLLALTQGESWGWLSLGIIAMFAASLVLISVFIWFERRTKAPIVSIELMKNKGIAGANIAALFVGLSMFLLFQTMPFFLMTPVAIGGFGLESAFIVGIYMFPSAIAQLIFAPLAGKWSKKIGADRILILGMGVTTAGTLMMAFFHSTVVGFALSMFVIGIGLGFAMVSLINVVAMSSPRAQFGVASGMNTLFRVVGGSIGPVLGTVIMTSFLIPYFPPGSPVPINLTSEQGYVWVWIAGAAFSFIGMVVTLIFRPGRGMSYEDEEIDVEKAEMDIDYEPAALVEGQ